MQNKTNKFSPEWRRWRSVRFRRSDVCMLFVTQKRWHHLRPNELCYCVRLLAHLARRRISNLWASFMRRAVGLGGNVRQWALAVIWSAVTTGLVNAKWTTALAGRCYLLHLVIVTYPCIVSCRCYIRVLNSLLIRCLFCVYCV